MATSTRHGGHCLYFCPYTGLYCFLSLLLSVHRTLSTYVRTQDFICLCPHTGLYRIQSLLLSIHRTLSASVRTQDFIAFSLYFCPHTGLYCLCPHTGLYRFLSSSLLSNNLHYIQTFRKYCTHKHST